MGDIGTFGSFTTARLGIYAAQKGLSVTGNNIANINTLGYTRQSLDQVSLNLGSGDRYQSRVNVGSGVRCIGVSQLRDPYLDIRYRTQMSTVGALDTKLSGLDQLSSILDEVTKNEGDGVLEKMLTDLTSALDDLSLNAGQDADDAAVRSAAAALVKQLNSYAKSLEEIRENTVGDLEQNLDTVNGILKNIRDLNTSIRKSEIHGDNALELRDQRNNLIDQLSQYVKIDVTYATEDIGAGQTIERLLIKLGNANPVRTDPPDTDRSTLVDGIYATQLLAPKANPDFPDVADSLPYLDVNDNPTSDPGKAAREFNANYDMMLSALTDVNGRVKNNSTVSYQEITNPDDFDPGFHDVTRDQYGKVTKLIEHIEKVIKVPAKVDGAPVTGPLFDASGLRASAIAKAGGSLPADGLVTLSYDEGSSRLNLLIDGTVVGVSTRKVTFPLTRDMQVDFQRTDGLSLGSVTVKDGATADDFLAQNTGLDFTAATQKTEYYIKTTETVYADPVALHDNDLYGSLQSTRELLTEKGEFSSAAEIAVDSTAAIKRGIPYYQRILDGLAQKLADTFNGANNVWQTDKNGNYLTKLGDGTSEPLTYTFTTGTGVHTISLRQDGDYNAGDRAALEAHLEASGRIGAGAPAGDVDAAIAHLTADALAGRLAATDGTANGPGAQLGGVLFSKSGNGDDPSGITASNISVSQSWSKGEVRICCSTLPEPGSQANDNVLHMISLMGTKLDYATDDGQVYLTGTFQEMLTYITGTLANDVSTTSTSLDNAYASVVDLDTSRDSVSGVDLNDEAMGMMQYQKSYAAACRLMTTLDEVLDKLINGTGVAGR